MTVIIMNQLQKTCITFIQSLNIVQSENPAYVIKRNMQKKLHMHERSFTYFFSKFYRLIEKKVFQYTALLALCKSDNSFQMQIDFSIKLPNKNYNAFPCYIVCNMCLQRKMKIFKLKMFVKCNISNETLSTRSSYSQKFASYSYHVCHMFC